MTGRRVTKAGIAASALQITIFLIALGKIIYPQPDITGALALIFFLGMTSAALYGFLRLGKSPEPAYFVLIVIVGFLLIVAGIITLLPFGIFILPGALAMLMSAAAYLVVGEGRVSPIRWIALFLLAIPFIVFVAVQFVQILYLLKIPMFFRAGV